MNLKTAVETTDGHRWTQIHTDLRGRLVDERAEKGFTFRVIHEFFRSEHFDPCSSVSICG